MVFHSHLATSKILDSSGWMLYTVTADYAYFVNMPYPAWEYSVKFCPSASKSQFNEAIRVARMKLDEFCKYAEKYRYFKGKVRLIGTRKTWLAPNF